VISPGRWHHCTIENNSSLNNPSAVISVPLHKILNNRTFEHDCLDVPIHCTKREPRILFINYLMSKGHFWRISITNKSTALITLTNNYNLIFLASCISVSQHPCSFPNLILRFQSLDDQVTVRNSEHSSFLVLGSWG